MRAFGLTMLGLLAACAARPAARSRGTITQHPDVAGQHPNPRFEVREIQPTDTIWLEPDDQREDRDLRALLTPPSSVDGVSFTGPTGSDDALGGVDATVSLLDGRLLVLDRRASVVRIVSPTGQQLGRIGRPGRGPGDFFHPLSIAVDMASNVYVGDLLRRVQRFRPDGRLDHVVALVALPAGGLLLQVGVSTAASEQAGDDYARLISVVLPREVGGLIERTTDGAQVAGILGARPVFSVTEPSPGVTWARGR